MIVAAEMATCNLPSGAQVMNPMDKSRTYSDSWPEILASRQKLVVRCAEAGSPVLLDVIEHGPIRARWCESRVLRTPGDAVEWVISWATVGPRDSYDSPWRRLQIVVGCYSFGSLEQLHHGLLWALVPPRQNYDICAPYDGWRDEWEVPAGEIRLFGWKLPHKW